MFKLIICFKHKPFVMRDSSVAGSYLASGTYTVIQIVTTFIAQREKNNQRLVQQNFHKLHIFGMENECHLSLLKTILEVGGTYFLLFSFYKIMCCILIKEKFDNRKNVCMTINSLVIPIILDTC